MDLIKDYSIRIGKYGQFEMFVQTETDKGH